MNKLFAAALAIAGAASPALAADLIVDAAPAAASNGIAGYVEASIGIGWSEADWGTASSVIFDEEWNEIALGGAARVAIPVAPQFALQLDAWASSGWVDGSGCDYFVEQCYSWDGESLRIGGAAHLAHKLDGATIGGMVSVGTSDTSFDNLFGTFALEGAATIDQLRLVAQVGVTRGITDDAADDNYTSVFAQGDLAYYIDPNLRISANASVIRYTSDSWDGPEHGLSWGARIEKKLDDTPISLFAAYQGWVWEGEADDQDWRWGGSTHAVKVGLRFAFGDGTETLQDLDDAVPFRDANQVYGISY